MKERPFCPGGEDEGEQNDALEYPHAEAMKTAEVLMDCKHEVDV